MNEDELKRRTKAFALRVMKLVGALPETTAGRVIGKQLIRSATSVGANYRAACRGRSKAEFVAKPGVVIEESDECVYCMELIIDGELLKKPLVESLLTEANERTAIMVASQKTAQFNNQEFIKARSMTLLLFAHTNPKSKIANQKC